MSRRILTFLMTDIQGSMRLWEQFPESMAENIAIHERIIEDSVSECGGRLIKSRGEGDSTFSVFENAGDAISAAMQAQAGLLAEHFGEGVNLRVRMAIHSGEAVAIGDDFFGQTVNRCARIREVAHGGQIIISGAAKSVTRDSKLSLIDLGIHRLRDLQRPEHLFQIDQFGTRFPPVRSLTSLKNNLPVQLSSFIGRQTSIEDIMKMIMGARLVSLVGTGGCGKTRLAIQVGAELLQDIEHGVWFIDMASLRSMSEIVTSISQSFGMVTAKEEGSIETLIDYIADMPSQIFILDNAEHILGEVAQLAEQILSRTSGIRLLVTSREPLRLNGEIIYRVPSLDLPGNPPYDLAELARVESVALFVERAQARVPKFELTPMNAEPIASLCKRLDGIPLAIEPIAAMVEVLSPAQLLGRLENQFSILSHADVRAIPRHRTIETAIDWSFAMLKSEEKIFLGRLSLIPATFSIDAVEALCSLPPLESEMAIGLVRALTDKSLVVCIQDDSEIRYRLLEIVRRFVSLRFSEPSETIRTLLITWTAEIAQLADAELFGASQAFWLTKLESDYPSLRLSLDWAIEMQKPEASKIAFSLRNYWMQRGALVEGKTYLQQTLPLADQSDSSLLAKYSNALGVFSERLSQFDQAEQFYHSALQAYVELDDTEWQAAVLNNLGLVSFNRGDLDRSIEYCRRSIELYRVVGNPHREALVLLNLGTTLLECGDYSGAIESYSTALSTVEEVGDLTRVASLSANIAAAHVLAGSYQEAKPYLRCAFESWRSVTDLPVMIDALLDVVSYFICNDQASVAAIILGGRASLGKQARHHERTRAAEQRRSLHTKLRTLLGEPTYSNCIKKGGGMNEESIREFALTSL